MTSLDDVVEAAIEYGRASQIYDNFEDPYGLHAKSFHHWAHVLHDTKKAYVEDNPPDWTTTLRLHGYLFKDK